jgi:hypothetical protein
MLGMIIAAIAYSAYKQQSLATTFTVFTDSTVSHNVISYACSCLPPCNNTTNTSDNYYYPFQDDDDDDNNSIVYDLHLEEDKNSIYTKSSLSMSSS